MVAVEFTVVGIAQPKGSTRAFLPKGWKRPIVTSDNPKNKGWQQLVAEEASRHVTATLDGPVRLTIQFYLPRPKTLPKKVAYHLKKPDLDKLVRSCKDALSKVVWRDDSQVVCVFATKDYALRDEPPHVRIRIEPIYQAAVRVDRLPTLLPREAVGGRA